MDVRLPDGTVIQNIPEGTTKADLVGKLKANGYSVPAEWLPAEKPASVQTGSMLNDIPRQVGLFARYAMEGPAQVADIATEPIRNGVNFIADKLRGAGITDLVTGKPAPLIERSTSQEAGLLADHLGLPKPIDANERVIGDATKMMAGGGATSAAGSALSRAPGLLGKFGEMLASAPAQNIASSTGAGAAASASREAGGEPWQQAVAGLVGGFAAPATLAAATGAAKAVGKGVAKVVSPEAYTKYTDAVVDNKIELALNRTGFDWKSLDNRTRAGLREEVRKALSVGQDLSGDALRRFVDFQRAGIKPTLGQVTLDPVQITREKNLSKIGANSADRNLQTLAQSENTQNTGLIGLLNQAGAQRGDLQRAGEAVTGAVTGRQAALRSAESEAWRSAKSSPGYTAPIAAHPISEINRALGEEGMMPFMNPTISRYMESFLTGQQFTPQAYRNLQSMLSNEMSQGGNSAAAAGLARRVLESSNLSPIGKINPGNLPVTAAVGHALRSADESAQGAIDAVNQARSATRAAYAYEESSPLVRSVLSDGATSDPMRIAQRYVIGGTANEAQTLAREVGPSGVQQIKEAVLAHLKDKALSGAADEVGKFSQAAYTKALNAIGDRKLSVFFSPEEVADLKRLQRVASYAQAQPVGSAVNNSNSGALMAGNLMDVLGSLGAKVPLGLKDTITGFTQSRQARQAISPARGLLAPAESVPLLDQIAPRMIYGGLLATPQVMPDR